MSDGAEDTLAAAFGKSFDMPPAEPTPAAPTAADIAEAGAVAAAATEAAEAANAAPAPGSDIDWKPEYEANLAEWRAEADLAREKAAATRARIEAEHAAEAQVKKGEAKKAADAAKEEKARAEREERLAAALADETRPKPKRQLGAPADREAKVREAWELVKEQRPSAPATAGTATPPAASTTASIWEDVSAPHSSVEDISVSAPGSSPSARSVSEKKSASPSAEASAPEPLPLAVPHAPSPATLAAGSPSLTLSFFTAPGKLTVSRVLAALGINLLLPFINGIMLGFGEITAREAVRVGRAVWRGEQAFTDFWRRGNKQGAGTSGVGLSGSNGF